MIVPTKFKRVLIPVSVLSVFSCAQTQSDAHYVYPDDLSYYKPLSGDNNQYIAELLTSSGSSITDSFPTYEISETWRELGAEVSPNNYPSGLTLSDLIVLELDHDVPDSQSQFKTFLFSQKETGELLLMALLNGEGLYWIKDDASGNYGIEYFPADISGATQPVTLSANLEKCDTSCLSMGTLEYSYHFIGMNTTKTVYATFDAAVIDSRFRVSAQGENQDVFYTLNSRNFYSPLVGKIAEAVSYTDTQKSLNYEYTALLAKTNIAIAEQYELK